jgi:hypothetical protein
MDYIFAEYINSLSLSEIQDENFNKLAEAIDGLPYIHSACAAAEAVYEKFKTSEMLGSNKHFRILKFIKSMRL